jgi:hypothetical protein
MTESSFFHGRAADIIAAYGGDTARWPDAERATALTVIAADPALAAALLEARSLDRDLGAWARRPVRSGDPRGAASLAMRGTRYIRRWAAGGSIAASVAAAIILLAPGRGSLPVSNSTAAIAPISDETAFAQVFTPTPDEERML